MSRIRTVKPELFRHEALFEAELYHKLPLRVAFMGLLTCCDRSGRFRWRPRQLKLDVMPYDAVDFEVVLNSLHEDDFVQKYECDGEYYGCIPSWEKHQSINSREPESVLPDPTSSKYIQPQGRKSQCVEISDLTQVHENADQDILPTITNQIKTHSSSDECATIEANSDPATLDTINNEYQQFSPSESVFVTEKTLDSLNTATNEAPSLSESLALSKPSTALPQQSSSAPQLQSDFALHMRAREEVEGKGRGNGREEEREQEGCGKPNVAQVRQGAGGKTDALNVFEFWKRTMRHPNAMLDQKRKAVISKALQSGYSVAQLCDAITGCSLTPHNMGDNDRGQRFDGLHLILRDADQIDRFISNCLNPPRLQSAGEKLIRSNAHTVQSWLEQPKMGNKTNG